MLASGVVPQVLTLLALLVQRCLLYQDKSTDIFQRNVLASGVVPQVLALLALLAQKYKYRRNVRASGGVPQASGGG